MWYRACIKIWDSKNRHWFFDLLSYYVKLYQRLFTCPYIFSLVCKQWPYRLAYSQQLVHMHMCETRAYICDLKLVQNEIACWLTDNFSRQKSQQYPYCIWYILVTFVAWYYCTVSIRGGLVPCCFGLRNGKQFIKDTVC